MTTIEKVADALFQVHLARVREALGFDTVIPKAAEFWTVLAQAAIDAMQDGAGNESELRDHFAGQALIGIGTWMPASRLASLMDDEALQNRADWAYRQADAMLKARGRKTGE